MLRWPPAEEAVSEQPEDEPFKGARLQGVKAFNREAVYLCEEARAGEGRRPAQGSSIGGAAPSP